MEEASKVIKKYAKIIGKALVKTVLPPLLIVTIIIVLIAGSTYIIMKWIADSVNKAATEYTSNVSISTGGTASTVVFPNGQDVGQDVTIGEERFKIIKKSTDGKTITAMPYYNLYIAGNPTTIKQATEDNYSSAGKIAFAPGSSPTWGVGKNIDIDNTTTYPNNVKEPIAKYETYLRDTLGASNVVAKIGRYYQVGTADATITEAEYIGNLSGLNPGSAATFWLGSSTSLIADNVHLVDSNGSVGYNDFYDASYGGVRPVIIITIS